MSTEIKPGQQGRAVRDLESMGGVKIRQGAVVSVVGPNTEPDLFTGRLIGGPDWDLTLRVEDFLFVPVYADATPAPLDPTLVKAGDTVTLTRGKAVVRDVVIEVKSRGRGQFLFYTGETPDPLIPGTYYLVNTGAWTLTDHQPAPEPEPEWKPGRFVSVRVNGRELPGERYRGFVTHHGTVMIANEDGSPESINLAHLRAIRPLVVIDPADVDVDALAETVRKAADQSPHIWYMAEIVRATLAELGIEAP